MSTERDLECEPNHTGQATYYIARDTKQHGVYHTQGSQRRKGSSISEVSISLSHGIRSKVDELNQRGQMTWNHPSTKVYNLYKHGMSNSLHIKFLN